MSIPRWNRVACTTCNGNGQSNICADCGKEITGAGNFENSDIRCICQDIPFGAI
jgi:RecJ-like exonuclease